MKPTFYNEGSEEDIKRLNQRAKQITYGINSPEYQELIRICPKWDTIDPLMPDPKWNCSKRNWDSLVRRWRRQIHRIVDIYRILKIGPCTSEGRERDIRRLSIRWRGIRTELLTHTHMWVRRAYPNWAVFDPLMPDIREKCSHSQWKNKLQAWRTQTLSIYRECFKPSPRTLRRKKRITFAHYLKNL